ncbi:MAG TPA: 50S ribosomal protein L15, partial [Planctomycetaceae bacterium]|nr:50S ribosomal protein L15 [Planctomycetaceae bacterium]
MILDDVHRGVHTNKDRKRIGRGPGSGHGKTAGRGHKGLYSRSGASRRLGYEGGQMALARRIAKRGFNNNQFAPVVAILSLSALDKYFEAGDEVTPQVLRDRGIVKGNYDVLKVLANGTLSKTLTVKAHRFSQAA